MAGLLSNPSALLGIADAPTFLDREIQRSLGRAQVEQAQAQTAALQQKQSRADQYQIALRQYLANPTAAGASQLISQFPEFSDSIRDGWKTLDTERQRGDYRQMAEIYTLIQGGKADRAASILETRRAADDAAGQPPSEADNMIIDALKSGDPQRVREAQGFIGAHLAAIDPERFKAAYGDKTALQRNVEYLQGSGRPELAESYLQGETNKPEFVQVRDAATGEVRTYAIRPNAVAPPQQTPQPAPITEKIRPPASEFKRFQESLVPEMRAGALAAWKRGELDYDVPVQVMDGRKYYQINGEWYDNPEGK